MSNACTTRRGLTMIELVAVLGVMFTLSGLTAWQMLPTIRRGRLHEAVNAIDQCAQNARQLARFQGAGTTARYGVKIVTDQVPAYVATILHETGNPDRELLRYPFNRSIQVFRGTTPTATAVAWYNQPITGYVIDGTGKVVDIAAVPTGDPQHLSLRTLDGQMRTALAVYRIGMSNAEDF